MGDNRRMSERLVESLELPRLAMKGCAHIELAGNREAIIEGCMGILEYDESVICLNIGSVNVRLSGSDMCIRSFDSNRVVIYGLIATIEFN